MVPLVEMNPIRIVGVEINRPFSFLSFFRPVLIKGLAEKLKLEEGEPIFVGVGH